MSASPIDLKHFISLGVFPSTAKLSHTVDKGTISDSKDIWYRKEMESPAKARREWLAQEFLRLLIPNQVETRLAVNANFTIFYILSKEVPGFEPLPEHEPKNFANGTYHGLGNIITGAYFIHEADLKNGNIGKNAENIVVKIDGDWAFASMHSSRFPPHSAKINVFQLRKLPFPVAYKTYNWLDLVIEGVYYQKSDIIDESIKESTIFKQELFTTLYKILLIPDSYLTTFVDTFIPAGSEVYSDYLIQRRNDLLTEILKFPEFITFVTHSSEAMQKIADDFMKHMASFIVNGTTPIISDDKKQIFENDVTFHREKLNNLLGLNLNSAVESRLKKINMETNGSNLRYPNFFASQKKIQSTQDTAKLDFYSEGGYI